MLHAHIPGQNSTNTNKPCTIYYSHTTIACVARLLCPLALPACLPCLLACLASPSRRFSALPDLRVGPHRLSLSAEGRLVTRDAPGGVAGVRLDAHKLVREVGDNANPLRVVDEVSFSILPGEMVAICGSTGSGKSTMLNILGCLDKPTSGRYLLNDKNVEGMEQNELSEIRNLEIGFIFQSFNLLPRTTALGNVMQPLIYRGINLKQRRQQAEEALSRVGLSERMDHLPNQLSGGQRQRVAIGRAIVREPYAFLFDEPLSNLDAKLRVQMRVELEGLHKQLAALPAGEN